MATGRTLWERLTAPKMADEISATPRLLNPLSKTDTAHVRFMNLAAFNDDELWVSTRIRNVERLIDGKLHVFVDYFLESDGKEVVLRIIADKDTPVEKWGENFLLLTQYYPEEPGPLGWCEESEIIINALNDGEFCRYKGEENEERYWRIGGNVPIACQEAVNLGWLSDNVRDLKKIERTPMTMWDYHRNSKDEVGQEFTQYLYAELSGQYDQKTGKIKGGNKTLIMWRGELVSSSNVMVY